MYKGKGEKTYERIRKLKKLQVLKYLLSPDEYHRIMEENRLLEKKAGYFRWMLDEYAGNAYIADMETYELLYINKTSYETLGGLE